MTKLFDRYKIQKKLKEVGLEGQEKLSRVRIAIVGLGGLGAPCSLYLAAAGVGGLVLIDGDQVEPSNLHRQVIYGETDIGKNKVSVAHKKLQKLNSTIGIESIASHINQANLARCLRDVDIILDCTDNFRARFLLNHFSIHQKRVYVFASVDRWSGQAALFYPDGPCLACLFSDVTDGVFQDCNSSGVMGPVVGLMAQLQSQLVLNFILMAQKKDTLHLYNAKTLTFEKITIQKRSDCNVCSKTDQVEPETENFYARSLNEISDYILIDIRDRKDFKAGALKGAKNIPFMDIINNETSMSHLHKSETYLLYCSNNIKTHFIRSVLKGRGFNKVFTLDKGYNEISEV